MNIGVIVQCSRTVEKDGEKVKQEWLDMMVRPPFMQSATLSVHQNKNKKKPSEPDFNLWYNFSRKGENFRGAKVGAMWRKTSQDGKTEYFSGHIENPLVYGGKMYITAFKAKPMQHEKAEDINWIYDVIWQPPKGNNNQSQQNTYAAPVDYSPQDANNSEPTQSGTDPMSADYSMYS